MKARGVAKALNVPVAKQKTANITPVVGAYHVLSTLVV